MKRPVVAITRPKDRAQKACEIVEKLGGEAILAPTLDLQLLNSESLKE
jgi:uroporphyrinogen-III synthase